MGEQVSRTFYYPYAQAIPETIQHKNWMSAKYAPASATTLCIASTLEKEVYFRS